MKIEEMKALKCEWGYTNEQISELTGIAVGTIQKIFSGETKSPRRETIQALEKLFRSGYYGIYPGPVYDFPPEGKPILLKEGNLAEAYGAASTEGAVGAERLPLRAQGEYTSEDYNNWPEESRIELIDGHIYNLAAVKASHEIIVGEILTELKNFTRKYKRSCIPFGSNIGVHIDNDHRTVLQPDITILCDHKKLHRDDEHIWGGPDLVMEVLSPSTRRKDMTLKLNKYCNGGVREYWLIDADKKQVIVYDFAHDDLISCYSFDEKVPVGIWDGACEIDFGQISSVLEQVFSEASDTAGAGPAEVSEG